jgi:hypothetical protein
MATIPTESRIFADRYLREMLRREALHADRISPGTKTWRDALPALYARMRQSGSPTRQAATLRKAITYLTSVKLGDCAHTTIGHTGASRSAFLTFATFSAGQHPLIGVDEEGINIVQHFVSCERGGSAKLISDLNLAYISKHAIGRLHERELDLTNDGATGAFAFIGMLGYLTRDSEKHIAGELCLHFGDTLVVGSLKHAPKEADDGREFNGTFYDVRTALPADEVSNQDMLEQGRVASHVVAAWFADPPDDDRTLADQIPFLPRRADDYTLRSAVVRH